MSCYGGPIETPNIDRIAAQGVRYTQWHTTALCSPTRSCLLTGRNHTRNSMACITEAAIGFPNASGTIPPENGMLPEILGERGWNTYMVGKWHLCPTDEMNLAATRRNWPSGRGFERLYGFLGAETNQWYPDLVYDNHPVDQPRSPEEGYHLTDDLTDKALEFIKDAKAIAPEKPFFLYYAPGACHAPHHAPSEWIDKFRGRFDMGYEAIREQTLARQKEMGIVPPTPSCRRSTRSARRRPGPAPTASRSRSSTTPGPGTRSTTTRSACSPGWPRCTPASWPTPTTTSAACWTTWRRPAQLDNTLVVVVSDNGASGEGGPNGSVNEMKFANGVADDLAENLAKIDDLGGPKTYNHYPTGWAMAFNTPFKMWKRYEFNGGTCDPCIISWPAGTKARGEIRDQYHHAIDIVPTILDMLGVEPPETIKGHTQSPFDGVSMRGSIDDGVRAVEPQDPVLRDARLPRDLARGLEGGHHAPVHRRLGPLQRRRVGALPHRRRPGRAARPGRRAPGQAPGAGEHLVRRGRRQRGVPARRPVRGRDPDDRASAAHRPAVRYVYFPGTAPVPEWQAVEHPQPLVRDRRAGRHPRAGAPRACCSPWARGSAATPST